MEERSGRGNGFVWQGVGTMEERSGRGNGFVW
jgi:hypothetical protein